MHVEPSTDRLYHGFGDTLYIVGIVLFESRQIKDRKQLIYRENKLPINTIN